MQQDSWNGKCLREMFRTGTQLLSNNSAAVNALNVFPVPDGDTGTNMLLTMQSAMADASLCPDNDASAVATAMAHGSLMGARGNSGVILSQILRGIAQGLEEKESFTASDMANALLTASVLADTAITHPVEGTILTVMRDASSAGKAVSLAENFDLHLLIETVVNEARESVNRTPSLLPVLRESGVVDAGGQGLCIIFEGLLSYLQGKELIEKEPTVKAQQRVSLPRIPDEQSDWGYCTEFLIQGNDLDLETIRLKLDEIGKHALVVGDERTARIHVHTFDPGAVLAYGTSMGTLHKIKIDNMEDQHREFLADQAEEMAQSPGNISTIAVVSGEGLEEVFKSIGASSIIRGGETMNPSVQELLHAVQTVPTNEVIILPNNSDVIATARQVCDITTKKAAVVPTKTIVQGITALVAFNYESDFDININNMTEGISGVRTGQIATAIRSMQHKDLKITEGQFIGFVNEELSVSEYTIEDTMQKLIDMMDLDSGEILTVYYGRDIDRADAEKLFDPVRSQYPELEIEIIFGGQPHYHYLISLE